MYYMKYLPTFSPTDSDNSFIAQAHSRVKNGILTDNHRFLLQMKTEAVDKTAGATFPEGIQGHVQNVR